MTEIHNQERTQLIANGVVGYDATGNLQHGGEESKGVDQHHHGLARAFVVLALPFPTMFFIVVSEWFPDAPWKVMMATCGCLLRITIILRTAYNSRQSPHEFLRLALSSLQRHTHDASSRLPHGFALRLEVYFAACVFYLAASLGFNGHQLLEADWGFRITLGAVIGEKLLALVTMTIFVYNPAVRKFFPPRLFILEAAYELMMAADLKLQPDHHFDGPWLYLLAELTFHYRYHKILTLLTMASAVWYSRHNEPHHEEPEDGERLLVEKNQVVRTSGVSLVLVLVFAYLAVVMAGDSTQTETAIYMHALLRLIQVCLAAVLVFHVTSVRHEDQHNLTTMESTFITFTAFAELIAAFRGSSFHGDDLPRAHAVEGISLVISTIVLALILNRFTSGMRASMKPNPKMYEGLYSTVLVAAVGFAFAFSVSDGIEQLLNGNEYEEKAYGTDGPMSHVYSVVYSIGNCLDSLSFLVLLSELALLRAQVTALQPPTYHLAAGYDVEAARRSSRASTVTPHAGDATVTAGPSGVGASTPSGS